jgi:hypothetical protein
MFGSVAAAQQRYVVDEAGQPHSQRKSQHQGLTKMQPSNAKNCAPRSYVYVRGHGRRSCSVIVQLDGSAAAALRRLPPPASVAYARRH